MDPRQSRGYRNRNPGNIEHNAANRWQGLDQPPIESAPPGGRARFARFVAPEYGIRALAMLLTTYQDRHGLRTIRGIISRWAPGSENDTEAYIAAVARRMDRHPRGELDLHRFDDLRPLVEAIIVHELGGNPYGRATIDAGLRLAGVVPGGREAVTRNGTARAAAGTAAAGVGGVAAA
ncbi:structural protein, partial [Roseomonas terrae]